MPAFRRLAFGTVVARRSTGSDDAPRTRTTPAATVSARGAVNRDTGTLPDTMSRANRGDPLRR
jgi:hypothetical protein